MQRGLEPREAARGGRPGRLFPAAGWVLVACVLPCITAVDLGAAEDPVQEAALHVARLHYDGGGDWYSNPSSIPNWLRGFQQRTGIAAVHEEVVVRPGDDLFRYPIAYLNGHGNVKFSDEDAPALRRWMLAGGFLWADDNYGMDASFRREVARIFPDRELVELPNDHPVFRSFYLLPGLPKIHEHEGKPPQAFAIFDGPRMVLLYTYESDIGDGLEDPEVHRDAPEKREAAMRMATNILMYALTN
jgi:hypothetical protein